MATKIENNFYDRFIALKPEGLTEQEWFLRFGWSPDDIRQKRSQWKRIEIPRPETIIDIQHVLCLSAPGIVELQYGNRITPPTTLRAGGGTPAKVGEDAAGKKRWA